MGRFIAIILYYTFSGFIGGIFIASAVGAVRHAYWWVIGLSLFFSIFHVGDMKRLPRRDAILRGVWIVTLTACIIGPVWLVAASSNADRWWFVATAAIVSVGVVGAFVLGAIEGIRKNSVKPLLRLISDWWFRVGGY